MATLRRGSYIETLGECDVVSVSVRAGRADLLSDTSPSLYKPFLSVIFLSGFLFHFYFLLNGTG